MQSKKIKKIKEGINKRECSTMSSHGDGVFFVLFGGETRY
jgi:hypothetical protein